ncbi:MAG: DNA repair protein RecN [Verrucomicrobia bacterium]|nr:DNA repair protein RecN [Verrucomicrobiota bacterium]MDA1086612.1 DNA repair protein RecN [Verrucomicrobiota bacterium]
MLQSLRVRNFAIAEDVKVEFAPGLNVVTGETGAGKSLLVDALGLVLGERADRTMIRTGEDQCSVEAVFCLAEPGPVDALLEALGFQSCEDGQLIVRRVITAAGSTRNFLNDASATLHVLKQVGDRLVDLHGPHDHQSLLSQEFQLTVLDAYGNLDADRAHYEESYREMLAVRRTRDELDGGDQQVAQQIDMLTFQVKEIEDAQVSVEEGEALDREHTVAANAQTILEATQTACQALTDGDTSAYENLVIAIRALNELSRMVKDAEAWRDEVDSLNSRVSELSRTLHQYAGGIDGDSSRLQWLETRKALYESLKRKYGDDVGTVLAFRDDAESRLQDLESRDERLAECAARLETLHKQLLKKGKALAGKRLKAASKMAEAVTTALRDLGFPEGAFDVALESAEPGPHGLDSVEFGFAPNPGEARRPLRAIASSGEISRVMLAIKSILAGHDQIPVLIFDEVDANVGGEMGVAVGLKLGGVAESHQVICITHLPQVAAHGRTHFKVTKEVAKGRTFTTIRVLDDSERTEEIARMLGDESSATARQHAEELLEFSGDPRSSRGKMYL